MELTIKSQKLKRNITFSRPGSKYIFADLNGKDGSLGKQICDGGYLLGNTITYTGGDQQQFNEICRSWYRSYIKNHDGFFVDRTDELTEHDEYGK